MPLEILFFISLFCVSYSYFVYPLILMILPKRISASVDSNVSALEIKQSNNNALELPAITFIITAFNEEKGIETKIINTLAVDYPKDKFEILVASDGSTDNTNAIVESFTSQGVKLVPVPDRKGKENAQRHAILAASGELLVFSDVSTCINSDSLHIIADAFIDPNIGAISSEDRFITNNGEVAGEGAYVKYEMWLRKLEGQVNSLVGLSGSFFAVRKAISQNWDISVPSDFNTALNCIEEKTVAISHPQLLGFYPNLSDDSKEYPRKVRTVIRGMAALLSKKQVLNPFKYGLFAFQVFSHKLMRWAVPWFLVSSLILNLFLLNSGLFYALVLAAQIALYIAALIGYVSKAARERTIIKIPFFFIQVNLAIAHAGMQFFTGTRVTLWTPSKR